MEWLAVPLAAVTVVSTLAGGLIALRLHRELVTLIALTGGIVVAVALFDVLPEAIKSVDDPERVTGLVGVGFLAFFLAERLVVLHHRDEAEQARAHAQVGALGAAGLSLHSFIDGLGIGLAFHLGTSTGLLVFLAVVTHDFADGMNTVNFVLSQSGERRQAIRWLTADSLAPLLGAIVGVFITVSDHTLGQLLAVYAGFFLYMGATDLLPQAHEHPSGRRVALTALGFVATFLVARAADLDVSRQVALGELAEALALGVVRAESRLVRVGRVGRDLLGDRAHLGHGLRAHSGILEQLLRPALRAGGGVDVALHEHPAEEHADPQVAERPEREQPARRRDRLRHVFVLGEQPVDEGADRLVDQRDPELGVPAHGREA